MQQIFTNLNNLDEKKCIILIGMPGAGKSTVGLRLANCLDWSFLDTDLLIEATYATKLQNVVDAMGRDEFLDMECATICSIQVSRTVLATGGSIIYRKKAMQHLQELGHIVYIDVSLPILLKRIASNPERGVILEPMQSFSDLLIERSMLYKKYAKYNIFADDLSIDKTCAEITNIISE